MGNFSRLDSCYPGPRRSGMGCMAQPNAPSQKGHILINLSLGPNFCHANGHSGECEVASDRQLRESVLWLRDPRRALYAAANYPIAETHGTEPDETRLLSCAALFN